VVRKFASKKFNCEPKPNVHQIMKQSVLHLLSAALVALGPVVCHAQKGIVLPTPEAAKSWLIEAMGAKDKSALLQLLGSDAKDIVNSGDPTYDDFILGRLSDAAAKQCVIDQWDQDTVFFNIGPNSWRMPIPLEKTDAGWVFNPKYDKNQILQKRIRRNQANAVEVCRAYVNAQLLYSQRDINGNGAPDYAQKFISTTGKRDGLYWPQANPAAAVSPLGPLVEKARARGYAAPEPGEETVYQGYVYRILTSQGSEAQGGARSYVVDGNMTGGFALVCWPVKYGDSGQLTFIVNQAGRVLQKDLGAQTADAVKKITSYNPDSSWGPANL
jgi:Protein of unknown function (DUF2950)